MVTWRLYRLSLFCGKDTSVSTRMHYRSYMFPIVVNLGKCMCCFIVVFFFFPASWWVVLPGAVVLASVLTWSLSFAAEVWPRSFPDGLALSQCDSRGPATRLFRYQNLSHIGETGLSGCRWQLWPQTHQHREVSPESSLSWSSILPHGQCFSFRRKPEI